jgi:hypothetical protein
VAISDHPGTSDFWVCDDLSVWSSSNKMLAGRDKAKHHKIVVDTSRFKEILSEHGRAHYVKIDIEGSDWLCLRDIDDTNAPEFISAESECCNSEASLREEEYLATIGLMRERGYDRFKLVNQYTLVPVSRLSLRAVFDAGYREELRKRMEQENGWHFPVGSSGPFGDAIPGPWMEFSEAVEVYRACREKFLRDYNLAFWFDWHATRVDR